MNDQPKPASVAEIANLLWAAKKWNPPKDEECEYDNNLWYVETGDERNCARGLSELDAKEIVEAHNSAVSRACEEATEGARDENTAHQLRIAELEGYLQAATENNDRLRAEIQQLRQQVTSLEKCLDTAANLAASGKESAKPASVAEIVSVLRRWGNMEEIEDVPRSLKRMAFSDMLALADWIENCEEAYAKGREHNDVCIAQPLREELQQLREQLYGNRLAELQQLRELRTETPL